jgi:post-segregation antitoxin (ccd killing protein)
MKKVIYASVIAAFFSASALAVSEAAEFPFSANDDLLDASRGAGVNVSQTAVTESNATSENNQIIDVWSGGNTIGAYSFSNAHGIIMVGLISGSANVTNMSANVNIVSAR